MLVLGLDPSLRSTGFGVVEGDRHRQRVLEYGVIRTSPAEPLHESILGIVRTLEDVIRRHRPTVLAMEDIFSGKNARVALILGHVRGAALVTCAREGLSVAHYPPTRIKETVTGFGRAAKEQVQAMVARILSLQEVPPPDAADALAAALTHLTWSGGVP